MPRWLILVLQWGGLALATLSAVALIYVLGIPGIMPAAEAEAAAEQVTAPVVLLVIGAVCAVVGFFMDRRKPTAAGQS